MTWRNVLVLWSLPTRRCDDLLAREAYLALAASRPGNGDGRRMVAWPTLSEASHSKILGYATKVKTTLFNKKMPKYVLERLEDDRKQLQCNVVHGMHFRWYVIWTVKSAAFLWKVGDVFTLVWFLWLNCGLWGVGRCGRGCQRVTIPGTEPQTSYLLRRGNRNKMCWPSSCFIFLL